MSFYPTCTSSTRPSNPLTGDTRFETDTNNIIIWDGSGWRIYENDGTTDNLFSLEFDGGDRLDTTYTTTASAFSFSFWMKSSDASTYAAIMHNANNVSLSQPASYEYWYPSYRGVGGNNGNDANITQGGSVLLTTDSNFDPAYTAGSASTFFDGDWHHVVVTLANEDVSGTTTARYIMYRDGQEFINQLCTTANGWSNNNPYAGGDGSTIHTFGQRTTGSNYMPYVGKLDQMAFFESLLTPQNVADIYNSGSGGDLLTLGFSPDAYYRVGYYSDDTNSNGSVASADQDIGTVADYSGNGHNASQTTTSLKPNYVADPAF